MKNSELLKELSVENLQEHHKALGEAIGIEALIKLSDFCGGTQIYIPQIYELMKALAYQKIAEEYDGNNIQALALKYRVSESTAYRILKDKISEKKNSPLDGQLSLL